jgi:hypothetical protein
MTLYNDLPRICRAALGLGFRAFFSLSDFRTKNDREDAKTERFTGLLLFEGWSQLMLLR